jgi:hypothetical protein
VPEPWLIAVSELGFDCMAQCPLPRLCGTVCELCFDCMAVSSAVAM